MQSLNKNWFPIALAREVKSKPISRTLLTTPVLLVRDEDSVVHAYRDACPHRGFPLSQSASTAKELRCAYHGYTFSHQGDCTEIPGLKGNSCAARKGMSLRKYETREEQGMVFVRLEKGELPSQTKPFIPELIQGASTIAFDFGVVNCGYENLIDNFMDSVHPAFVHPFLLTGQKKNQVNISVHTQESGVEAVYTLDGKEVSTPGVFGKLLSGKTEQQPSHIERFHLPSIHQIDHQTSGSRFIATQYCVPVEENKTRVLFHLQIKSPWPKWIIAPLVRIAVYFLIKQDQKILEALELNLKTVPDFKPKSTVLDAIGLRAKQLMDTAHLKNGHFERAPIEFKAEL